jgi:hypothetical protein
MPCFDSHTKWKDPAAQNKSASTPYAHERPMVCVMVVSSARNITGLSNRRHAGLYCSK